MAKPLLLSLSLLFTVILAGCSAQPEADVETSEEVKEHRGSISDR